MIVRDRVGGISVAAALRRAVPRMLGMVVFAVVVVSALLLFADVRELGVRLGDFDWWLLLPAVVLTLWNYLLRFARWQLYLRRLGVETLPAGSSALVFLSGFAMSITPGKVGELIKCSQLQRLTGLAVSRSSAIVVAERLADGIAMLVLAGLGVAQFAAGRAILAIALVGSAAAIVLLRQRRAVTAALARLPSLPGVESARRHADAFLEAADAMLGPKPLGIGAAIGVVAWLGECAAFFVILVGLGLPPSGHLFLVATFVLAVSSLAGAISMLPGGLGVAEASVTAMLLLLVHDDAMDRGTAVAATLLIRLATLWFAVLLGGAALLLLQRRGRGRVEPEPTG